MTLIGDAAQDQDHRRAVARLRRAGCRRRQQQWDDAQRASRGG
jgi:hypothetical protein